MSDYITKQEVLKLLTPSDTRISETYIALVREEIKLRPSADAVKVVRCKDCKYAELHKDHNVIFCEINELSGRWIKADDYCSYGEQKER